MIGEREAIEVALWEDYLVFANLLGIAKKVESQFKKLYPDLAREMQDTLFINSYVAYHFSSMGIYSANAAAAAASRASGGFGGGSFSGGGGGAGGGFGGGFR